MTKDEIVLFSSIEIKKKCGDGAQGVAEAKNGVLLVCEVLTSV